MDTRILDWVYPIMLFDHLDYNGTCEINSDISSIFNHFALTQTIQMMVHDGNMKVLKGYSPDTRRITEKIKSKRGILQVYFIINDDEYILNVSNNGRININVFKKKLDISQIITSERFEEILIENLGAYIKNIKFEIVKIKVIIDTIPIPANTDNNTNTTREGVVILPKPVKSDRSRVVITTTNLSYISDTIKEIFKNVPAVPVKDTQSIGGDRGGCQHYFFRKVDSNVERKGRNKRNNIKIGAFEYYCDPLEKHKGHKYIGYNISGSPCCFTTENRETIENAVYSTETIIIPSNYTVTIDSNLVNVLMKKDDKKNFYFINKQGYLELIPREFYEQINIDIKEARSNGLSTFINPVPLSLILDTHEEDVNGNGPWPFGGVSEYATTGTQQSSIKHGVVPSNRFYRQTVQQNKKIEEEKVKQVDKNKLMKDGVKGALPFNLNSLLSPNVFTRLGVPSPKYLIDAVASANRMPSLVLRNKLSEYLTYHIFANLNNGKIKEKYKDITVYINVINDDYYDMPYFDIIELMSLVLKTNVVIIENNKGMSNARIPCVPGSLLFKQFDYNDYIIVLSQNRVCDLIIGKNIIHKDTEIPNIIKAIQRTCLKKLPPIPNCKLDSIDYDEIKDSLQIVAQIDLGYFKTTHVITSDNDIIPIKERPLILSIDTLSMEQVRASPGLKNLSDTISGYKKITGTSVIVIAVVKNEFGKIDSVQTNTGIHVPVSPSDLETVPSRLPILKYKTYYDVDSHILDFVNQTSEISDSELYYMRYNNGIKRIHDTKVQLYRAMKNEYSQLEAIKEYFKATDMTRIQKVYRISEILSRYSNEKKIILDVIATEITNDPKFKFITGLFLIEAPTMRLNDNEELKGVDISDE